MPQANFWTVSDTDEKNFPRDNDELFNRFKEIRALIPQPTQREGDNNIRFVQKAFELFKDCNLISKENVESLNDSDWCYKKFNELKIKTLSERFFKMNPLGGVLRREGLSLRDTGGRLRYYPEMAVICEGTKYYISNDWYSDEQPRYTKTTFLLWLMIWTMKACEAEWAEQSVNEAVNPEGESVTQKADSETILQSLRELHKKVDELTAQVEEIKNLWK